MIELDVLDRNTFGDRQLRDEVLGLFRQQSLQLMARLEETSSATDWKISAHKLKGSALGIGAQSVAQLAAQVEQAFFSNSLSSRDAALAPLRQAIEATNREISGLLA